MVRLPAAQLAGVNMTNRTNREGWRVQILHVWAQSERVARLLRVAHALLSPELRARTVVCITVVRHDKYGLDRVIFGNVDMRSLAAPLLERLTPHDPQKWRREQQQQWRALTPLGTGCSLPRKGSSSGRLEPL